MKPRRAIRLDDDPPAKPPEPPPEPTGECPHEWDGYLLYCRRCGMTFERLLLGPMPIRYMKPAGEYPMEG